MVSDKVASGLAFWRNTQKSLVNPLRFKTDKTFIFPTGFGFAFGGISFVLLIMAIGYSNNLLYFFVFLLISMAMTGMWFTNKNVDNCSVTRIRSHSLFARKKNILEIETKPKNADLSSFDIEFEFVGPKKKGQGVEEKEVSLLIEALPGHNCRIHWTPEKRGRQRMPRIQISSRFPFGMLRAWKYHQDVIDWIVYPELKGQEQFPPTEGGKSNKEADSHDDKKGLFRDFRDFDRSDSPSRIDWKRSLKHQKLLVKNFETSGEKKVLIEWEQSAIHSNFEDRISQMAYWVDLSHKKQDQYALKIGSFMTPFSNVPGHYRLCMETLAELTEDKVEVA